MNEESKKHIISISVRPAEGRPLSQPFAEMVKKDIDQFLEENDYRTLLFFGYLSLDWYDDFPVSDGVLIRINFFTLEAFEAIAAIQRYLNKNKGYKIFVNLGF